jgi:hypothetical protein
MQTIGLSYVIQFLQQRGKYFLKDLTGLILVETGAPGNCINQPLVPID